MDGGGRSIEPSPKRARGLGWGFNESSPRRDLAAECSDAPREVCELALVHLNSDCVEVAYRRSDLFERRRGLMADWAAYRATSRFAA